MTGHDAKILGDDNAKNGADRILDGMEIQSNNSENSENISNTINSFVQSILNMFN
jgi:hypothetical protein